MLTKTLTKQYPPPNPVAWYAGGTIKKHKKDWIHLKFHKDVKVVKQENMDYYGEDRQYNDIYEGRGEI